MKVKPKASKRVNPNKNKTKYKLLDHAAELLPDFRVSYCMRRMHGQSETTDGFYNAENKAGFYGGLQTCGSVWSCPVCSQKIAMRRKAELEAAIEAHEATGGIVAMVTLTMSHHKGEGLTETVEALKASYRQLKSGRSFKDFRENVGLVGSIAAFEVTFGGNGWHPHLHTLVFLPNKDMLPTVNEWFTGRWADCLEANGRVCNEHGVSVDYMSDKKRLDRYLFKDSNWGLSSEMVASHAKDSGKSRTPMQLLRDAQAGDEEAGRLFQEYSEAMKGRQKLVWSRGLRKKLLGDVPEVTDEELAEEVREEGAVKVVSLTPEQWSRVVELGLRGKLLDVIVASKGDKAAVRAWLVRGGVLREWESSG